METPIVSVIITTYKGSEYLGETIDSVLAQTYPHFELIIVDDSSPDNTKSIVGSYSDPRIRYLCHERNLGANQAWQTGLNVANGDLIACLDQDDLFHPHKLQAHVDLFRKQPDVGFAYNGRFEMDHSGSVEDIWQPPVEVGLADLVMGFPFAPSDMVLRRDWALTDGIWDDAYCLRSGHKLLLNGVEIVYCSRLYFAGCKFAGIPRALNYRRRYSNRIFENLLLGCKQDLVCQNVVFGDPRCPEQIRAIQPQAFLNTYLAWASLAFRQGEIDAGRQFLLEAARCNPTLATSQARMLVESLMYGSLVHDHEELLRRIFSVLPLTLSNAETQLEWAIGRGSVLQGTKALMWGQDEKGRSQLRRAIELHAELDDQLIGCLATHLLNYQREFGSSATDKLLRKWRPHLVQMGNWRRFRKLRAQYRAACAFRLFHEGRYAGVTAHVLQAMVNNARYVLDRGMLSILAHSMRACAAGAFSDRCTSPVRK